MPRYRVLLEFDHPGEGVPTGDQSLTCAPNTWRWEKFVSDDATNLRALEIYEHRPEWVRIDAESVARENKERGDG